jgi:hypothetical protein
MHIKSPPWRVMLGAGFLASGDPLFQYVSFRTLILLTENVVVGLFFC